MKLLVIPDIHNRVEWAETLLAAHPGWDCVFLGDYFDSFGDGPAQAEQTAKWLRWSIEQPGRTHLMGNHDLPYRWNYLQCPGCTAEKQKAVNRVMTRHHWGQTKLVKVYQPSGVYRPLVISHAGITLANLYGVEDAREVAANGRLSHLRQRPQAEQLGVLWQQAAKCEIMADGHMLPEHSWLNQGSRMGHRNVGGPFWIDRHVLHPLLPGCDQIVGHTPVRTPVRHCTPNQSSPDATAWFIDGHGRYAAQVESAPEEHALRITPIYAEGPRLGRPWAEPNIE